MAPVPKSHVKNLLDRPLNRGNYNAHARFTQCAQFPFSTTLLSALSNSFAYPDYAGEGMTLDVSERGIRMITNREIVRGVQLYARLLPTDGSYIDFPTATVKWCQSGQIGLEVSEMEQDDERRLSELLHHLEQPVTSVPE